MRSVQDQLAAVLAIARPVPALDVVLTDAAGCILATDIVVTEDVPSRPVATCDGYAVRAADVAGASSASPTVLPVVHDVWSAADEPFRLVPGQSVLVGSGVPMPIGADALVPVWATDRGGAKVRVSSPFGVGANVRAAGADVRAGDVALSAGTRLDARQLAFAASLGYARIRVHPAPRVVILPVGDELVQPGSSRPGVFDANGPSLRTAVQDTGAVAIQVAPVSDDQAALRDAIEDQLVRADLVITTGGLSEGSRDTLKDVLAPLGTVRFDHVAMIPGRNQGFGTLHAGIGSGPERPGDTIPVFSLPGHPVAAQISYEVFVRPALRAMAGYSEIYRPSVAAHASVGWRSPAGVRQFVPATLVGSPDEGYHVTPVGDPTRLDELSVAGLAGANALAVVAEGDTEVRFGDRVHCLVLEG
ncbi:gephyrin-like molybdotransferase Glp [Sanguibacter antarcticus]|uniref:molybdopterin molybdotransferase MoeA n=1 Tax=Sanguibacter antarcticus TaxID=372484 RepID=UPI000BF440E5|nr:gephyrin-like molybdotransferase Glp [Sanguibacter antarcticus]